ncbi:MAG: NAD-dependent epimerase/dehydratase family protein [Actinomycetes bacterium]
MRVLVTGGAGFIGANLVRRLAARGVDTVVLDDLSTGRLANLDGLDVRFVEASVLDRAALDDALGGADAVVHLAALPSVPRSVADPVACHDANVTGTVEVLEACRRAGTGHVVVASSSSVYGANPDLPKRESMRTAPLSPYAVSKLAAESYALAYRHCYGLDVLAFRFFNVFGPLQPADHAYAAVVPRFVEAALAGRPLTLFGDGEQSRDFTFVGTVCDVIADALARHVVCDTPVNLAFGSRTTLNALVGLLEVLLGRPVAREHTSPRPGDVRDSQADATLLHGLFPGVRAVPLPDGLQATVSWFESRALASGLAGQPTTT